jgi:hypothetical protein
MGRVLAWPDPMGRHARFVVYCGAQWRLAVPCWSRVLLSCPLFVFCVSIVLPLALGAWAVLRLPFTVDSGINSFRSQGEPMSVAMDQFHSATRYAHHWPPDKVAPPAVNKLEARQSRYSC